ncbi:PilZ domain-containing protein [Ruminiclostridium herbifermentans]|uniref:PilZ domain-containing protein n=1 Tax=Ruminiclostridium herbifermentans TaxID=2488810 RepID=A0A4U7JHU1_9FIRM|nr:PilZ domain-containing protein [Ruminiclostridium herbifermentans]QNU67720.1 PilZ domain-containing protein [Ruminiclostridium herbifermentans]
MTLVLKHYTKIRTMNCSIVSGDISKLVTVRFDDTDCKNVIMLKGDPVLLGIIGKNNEIQIYGGRVIAFTDGNLLIYSKEVKTDVLELRRKYFRHPVSLLADVKIVGAPNWEDACIIDVSYSGMRICSVANYSIGSIIEINVFLSNNVSKFEALIVRKAKNFNRFEYGAKILIDKNDIFGIHKKIYNILREELSIIYTSFVDYNVKCFSFK